MFAEKKMTFFGQFCIFVISIFPVMQVVTGSIYFVMDETTG